MTTLHQRVLPMMGWIRRILIGVAVLFAVVVVVGLVSEAVIRQRVANAYPVAGRLIDIGGRSIQLDCRGTGSPTIVLEGGLDLLGSLSWSAVHDILAATTRVCAYSRAGILWSGPSDQSFSVRSVALDLHETLAKAGERGPIILVAHSIGGLYATEYVRQFSGDVAGLVLVDASHPDQVQRLEAATGIKMLPSSSELTIATKLSRTGILRFLPVSTEPSRAPAMAHRISSAFLPVSIAAAAAEVSGLPSTFDGEGAFRAFGDLPLVVLTAGAPAPATTLQQMGMSEAQELQMRTEWIAMQEERSRWSSRGRHVVLNDATHYVQFDRPDAVVQAVQEVILAANTQRRGGK